LEAIPKNGLKKRSDKLKYLMAILGVVVLIVAINPNIIDEFSNLDYSYNINIEDQNCDTLSDMIKGLELQNVFGAKSKVITIRDSVELNRSENLLRCKGTILTSSGLRVEQEFFLQIEQDEYFYGVGNQ
jgi:hypothetical protein